MEGKNFNKTEQNNLKDMKDDELVSVFLSKGKGTLKQAAFKVIHDRHNRIVYSIFYNYVQNKQEAEDLSQELFVKVANALESGKYSEQGTFVSWIATVARNHCRDYLRRQKFQIKLKSLSQVVSSDKGDYDVVSFLKDQELNPENSMIYEEIMSKVNEYIAGIKNSLQKDSLRLRMKGKEYKEIASELGVKLGTMQAALKRARDGLDEFLKSDAFR